MDTGVNQYPLALHPSSDGLMLFPTGNWKIKVSSCEDHRVQIYVLIFRPPNIWVIISGIMITPLGFHGIRGILMGVIAH